MSSIANFGVALALLVGLWALGYCVATLRSLPAQLARPARSRRINTIAKWVLLSNGDLCLAGTPFVIRRVADGDPAHRFMLIAENDQVLAASVDLEAIKQRAYEQSLYEAEFMPRVDATALLKDINARRACMTPPASNA